MRVAFGRIHSGGLTAVWLTAGVLARAAVLAAPIDPVPNWLLGEPIFLDGLESGECAAWSASSNPLAAPDFDFDSFGDELLPTVNCSLPADFVFDVTDCDDTEPDIHPGAIETCSGLDEDCDDLVDAEDPDLFRPFCELQTGVCNGALKSAERCVGGQWDACTDADYAAHSSAYENPEATCDGLDNDCDGATDDGIVADTNPDCAAAVNLGSVSGDSGNQQITSSGFDERFFLVTIREDSDLNLPVLARIQLDSPPTADFDLFVRCLSCSGVLAGSSTQGPGLTDVVDVGRDDGFGVEDTYVVLIEVRFASASPCGFWQLDITGNVANANRACD